MKNPLQIAVDKEALNFLNQHRNNITSNEKLITRNAPFAILQRVVVYSFSINIDIQKSRVGFSKGNSYIHQAGSIYIFPFKHTVDFRERNESYSINGIFFDFFCEGRYDTYKEHQGSEYEYNQLLHFVSSVFLCESNSCEPSCGFYICSTHYKFYFYYRLP